MSGGGGSSRKTPAPRANRARRSVFNKEERAAPDRGQRERPGEQRVEHVLLAAGVLEIAGDLAQRAEPAPQVVEDEQEDAGADREGEQDVEVVAPGVPGPAGAKERVVEVVQAPEDEGDGEERPAAGGDPAAILEEDPAGPERREAEEQHRRDRRPTGSGRVW